MAEYAALIGIAVGIASAAVGTYTAVSSASSNRDLQESQSKALEAEAVSKQDAADYEERQFRRKAALLMGKQQAIYGASGFETGSGSPLLQELDTVRQAELEALNIRRSGDVAASTSRFESGLAKYRSNYYGSSIAPSVIGGATSGTGSVLSSWMKYS